MGLRFRKSMKIMPGVRINLSASGVSTTLGPKGATVSVGKRGIYANVSVPGTGLSFREKLNKTKAKSTQNSKGVKETLFSEVKLELLDNGSIRYVDNKENTELSRSDITFLWQEYGDTILEWLEKEISTINNNESILNIHYDMPSPTNKPQYSSSPFAEKKPVKPSTPLEQSLGWIDRLFFKKKVIKHKENTEKLKLAYLHASQQWEKDVLQWKEAQKQHDIQEQRAQTNFNQLIGSDISLMERHFESVMQKTQWPRETFISYDIIDEGAKFYLDVDLPEIEDLPIKTASLAANGKKVNIKDKTQKQQRLDYARHIHGIALKLSAIAFSELPSINEVVVSGYSQRLNEAIGKIEDDYLYSVLFTREGMEKLNYEATSLIDPIEAINSFENNKKMTVSGVFKPILPL